MSTKFKPLIKEITNELYINEGIFDRIGNALIKPKRKDKQMDTPEQPAQAAKPVEPMAPPTPAKPPMPRVNRLKPVINLNQPKPINQNAKDLVGQMQQMSGSTPGKTKYQNPTDALKAVNPTMTQLSPVYMANTALDQSRKKRMESKLKQLTNLLKEELNLA